MVSGLHATSSNGMSAAKKQRDMVIRHTVAQYEIRHLTSVSLLALVEDRFSLLKKRRNTFLRIGGIATVINGLALGPV